MNLFAFLRQGLLTMGVASIALFSVAQAAADLGFTDDAEIPSWAEEAIEELMDQGVVSGNDDGSFAPNRQLNRAEVSKVIVLATGVDMDTTGGPHFPDVAEDAWYYDYIETMYNQGWINGYPDGMFRPGVGINRAEIAKMVVNGFLLDQDLSGAPHFDDVAAGDWFYGYVETIYNNGCMRGYGDGTFGPGNAVTRAETVKIVYDCQLVALGDFGGIAEGTLEVMLSNDTPRGTNIPFNATSVPFTTVEMTAADDADIEIASMTFTRLGLGDNDDFDNVWLEIDGFKVGNDKSVNNDDVVELRFNPPIVVPAGQTIVADVVASMKFTATDKNVGHHNRFVLVSADDVVTSAANIAGDFPIEGEEMEIADYEVTQVRFDSLGSDTVVDVGDSFVEIGKFGIENNSNTNKDVELRAITFKNDGTAELEDDLENVALYVSGEQVSAETIMDGDYITFRLDNGVTGGYILEDGDSKIFSIRADIVSAEKGDVINFKVDNFEDVVGVEIGTAFGVKAVSDETVGIALDGTTTTTNTTACAGENAEDNCARLRAYAIEAGDLVCSRDPSSLNNQEYAPGSNDVVFLTARVIVDQPVIVDGVTLNLDSQTGIADLAELNTAFDNFRLYLNDKLIDTENDFTGADLANATLVFNTTFELAGTSILKLVGNIQNDATDGDQIKMALNCSNAAFDSPEYISTGDQLDTVLGSAEASFVTVQDSALVISRTDGFSDANEQFVAGVDDLTALEFTLDNNDSGDVNVTSVTIKAEATGAAKTNIQNFTAAIFVDGTQQGSSRNLNSSGVATFNDISVVLESATQKEFEVVLDTNQDAADSNPGSSTLATGTGSTSVALLDVDGGNTNDASVNAGSTVITLVTPTTVALSAGDEVVVSAANAVGTALSDSTAEVRTLAVDAAIGATSLTVTTAFTNGHAGEDVYTVGHEYAAGTSSITLANAANFSAGDVIDITGATGGIDSDIDTDTATDDFCVASVSGNVITLGLLDNTTDTCASPATTDTLGTAVATGAAVVEIGDEASVQIMVTAVDADNVENGQQVTVKEANDVLGSTDDDTNTDQDGDCNAGGTANGGGNYLCGATFGIIQSGKLKVEVGSTVYSDILVDGQTDAEVLKIRLTATDDEIQVSDLYFKAATAAGNRVDFKLYNESGSLIQSETMISGELHFELGNNNRIRVPKDGSTTVTVKVDVRSINDESQTGKILTLALDALKQEDGFEAVTAATGSDLATTDVTVPNDQDPTQTDVDGDIVGNPFLITKTQLTIRHATTQASISDPSTNSQEMYRFTVTADAANEAEINQATFRLALSGMARVGTTAVAQVDTFTKTDASNAGTTSFEAGDVITITVGAQTQTYTLVAADVAADDNVLFGKLVSAINTGGNITTVTAALVDKDNLTLTSNTAGTPIGTPTTIAVTTDTSTDGVATITGATTTANVVGSTSAFVAGDFAVKQVKSDGTIDDTADVDGTISVANATSAGADIKVPLLNQVLDPGESRTYALFVANTANSGTEADDDSASVTILTDATQSGPAAAGTLTAANNIVWSDESDTNTSNDYFNGYLLEVDSTAQVNND